MYEEVEAEEIRPVFSTQMEETSASSKFDSGVSLDLNTSATSSSATPSSVFSKTDISDERIEHFESQLIEGPANVESIECRENVSGGSQYIKECETETVKSDVNLVVVDEVEKVIGGIHVIQEFQTQTVKSDVNLVAIDEQEKVISGTQKMEEVNDEVDDTSVDRDYIEIISPEMQRLRPERQKRKRDQYDEPLEKFVERRRKAKEQKKPLSQKVQSFITNLFSNKVKREKKNQDDADLDILSSQQYQYTPKRKMVPADEPDIEIIDVRIPNQPSMSTPVVTSASASCSINLHKDVSSDSVKSEEVVFNADANMEANLKSEVGSQQVVEERDQLQKQVEKLSKEMEEMKQVISRKRILPKLMYAKTQILRKSKALKIGPRKRNGKSTKKETSADGSSGTEDSSNKMGEGYEMSSMELVENEGGKKTESGTEDGAKNMDQECEKSSMEMEEDEADKKTESGTEDSAKNMDQECEKSSMQMEEDEADKKTESGTEDGAKNMDQECEKSSMQMEEDEADKKTESGTEDGAKNMDQECEKSSMQTLKNQEFEDSADDGTSTKKNQVYPTSNLVLSGEYREVQKNINSKDKLTEENNEAGKTGSIDFQEPLSDMVNIGCEGTDISSAQEITVTGGEDIEKKNYVASELDDGDEYSESEAILPDSVPKENVDNVPDLKNDSGNTQDVTDPRNQKQPIPVYCSETRDATNGPAENEDDLLGNPSEAVASDFDVDEHQENKLLGEENANQTETKTSPSESSNEDKVNEDGDGEQSEDIEDNDNIEEGDDDYDGEEGDNDYDADEGEEGADGQEGQDYAEEYEDENELDDEDPGFEGGNASNEEDAVEDDGQENEDFEEVLELMKKTPQSWIQHTPPLEVWI